MKKIKVEIEISNIDKWSVDWDKGKDKELKQLNWDIKIALYDHVGIDMDSVAVKSELLTQENE